MVWTVWIAATRTSEWCWTEAQALDDLRQVLDVAAEEAESVMADVTISRQFADGHVDVDAGRCAGEEHEEIEEAPTMTATTAVDAEVIAAGRAEAVTRAQALLEALTAADSRGMLRCTLTLVAPTSDGGGVANATDSVRYALAADQIRIPLRQKVLWLDDEEAYDVLKEAMWDLLSASLDGWDDAKERRASWSQATEGAEWRVRQVNWEDVLDFIRYN